jgi:hypothetical protein
MGDMGDHSKHMNMGGKSDYSKQTTMGQMGGMNDHSKQMTMDGMSDHSKQATMGGMGDHSKHMTMGNHEQMATPENSIAMMGREGPYGTIDMGGMFTVLKVRENLTSYADPGWYQPPAGTVAQKASRLDLERDGIKA